MSEPLATHLLSVYVFAVPSVPPPDESSKNPNSSLFFASLSSRVFPSLEDNEAKNNDGFGFEDGEIDGPDDDNTYNDNKCVANDLGGSEPTGLCSPQN